MISVSSHGSKESSESEKILRVSIVSYAPDINLLKRTILSLITAAELAIARALIDRVELWLINNGPTLEQGSLLKALLKGLDGSSSSIILRLAGDGSNVGFGVGHNLVLSSDCDFHLVLNPDVELDRNALIEAIEFMHEHVECGLLSPSVKNGVGEREFVCKRYPAVFDLALRGFAPAWLQQFFLVRLHGYEMRAEVRDEIVWGPPIVSGCFMLIRNTLLQTIKGFDPRFFLYFEDFDLSLRAAKTSQIAYVPSVKIVHHGGNAAKKGWRHIYLFVRSGIQFFNKHGWKWI